jgi:hypothetical protein
VFHNEFAQTLEIRWGRITRVTVVEDTEKMSRILSRVADHGDDEAIAPQIADVAEAAIPPDDADGTAPDEAAQATRSIGLLVKRSERRTLRSSLANDPLG